MRFWIVTVSLLVLAVLGLATIPRAVDWDGYRSDIESAASRLSGHEVRITGPIDVRILPRPVLTARDVSVSAAEGGEIDFELASGQMEAVLELGPLLAGRPVVRSLDLRRPVFTLRGEQSRRLLAWPPKWRGWASPFLRLGPERIGIDDGRVALEGIGPKSGVTLGGISLDIQSDPSDGSLDAAGLFESEHHSFTVAASVGHPNGGGASPARLTVEARNGIAETTSLSFSGEIGPQDGDGVLAGQITVEGPDLQHGLAALSSATGYPSTFRFLAAAQPFELRGRLEADREGVRASDLQVALSEKLGGASIDVRFHPQSRLDLGLDLPTLHLADDAPLVDFLPLDLLSKLELPPGRIDLRLREIVYRDQSVRQAGVRLDTGADRVTVVEQAKAQLPGLVDVRFDGETFPGTIGPRLEGRLEAVGDDLGSTLAWLGLIGREERGDGWRRFGLESDVDVTSVEIALSAVDMTLDSARLEGGVSLRFGERLTLGLDVDVDRLNLDLYSGLWRGEGGGERLLALASDANATIAARFRRLIWRDLHVEEASIAAGVENMRLALESIAATTVGETTVEVSGDVDLAAKTGTLEAALASRHPMRAARQFGLSPPSSARPRPIEIALGVDGRLDRFDVGLQADYDGGRAVIEGEAGWTDGEPAYDVTIDLRHPDHLALAGHFGLAPLVPAGDAAGGFELTGKATRGWTQPFAASGSAKLGPSSFTGSLTYRPDAAVGPWEARLSVGRPQWDSLAPFLALSGLRLTDRFAPQRWLGRLPKLGLHTAWLDRLEGSISLASKGGLVGDGLRLSARLVDGLLYVNRFEASPWQGALSAELTLERRRDQPFASIALDLDQVEAAALASWLGAESGLTGPLDLHLEAATVGVTPYDLMAGLSGSLSVDIGPGELSGLEVPALRRALIPPAGAETPVDRSLSQPFERIEAKAELGRGILSLDDADLSFGSEDGETAGAAIDGTIDLLLWIVDLSLRPAGADTEGEAAPPAYRIVGPPDRPQAYISAGNR